MAPQAGARPVTARAPLPSQPPDRSVKQIVSCYLHGFLRTARSGVRPASGSAQADAQPVTARPCLPSRTPERGQVGRFGSLTAALPDGTAAAPPSWCIGLVAGEPPGG